MTAPLPPPPAPPAAPPAAPAPPGPPRAPPAPAPPPPPARTTSACLGMNSMSEDKARALCETLALGDDVAKALQGCPHKHWDKTVPTDPLVYRFYEMINVYGDTIKALIHEKFGDGIMSAIDFTMDITKEENPKGDRVVITLNGNFLPYKAW